MKRSIYLLVLLCSIMSSVNAQLKNTSSNVKVAIDLLNVKEDKVIVTVCPPKITSNVVLYQLPKIVPGTYSADNYGQFIEGFRAFDAKGNELNVTKSDVNSWKIVNARKLTKITYAVNDTYDIEKGEGHGKGDVFSPAGTNIEEGKNFMVNTHGFVGYFPGLLSTPYQVTITHPEALWGATSMQDTDDSKTKDVFYTSRYAELVENPIMYSKPNYSSFTVNGMQILLSVYASNGTITAESILPEVKAVMTAQKTFLGSFDTTKKYSILLYLCDMSKSDARGFGALEHPTATTVVMPEVMGREQLVETLKDVISHEFFHIVTPLTIHSKEIQDFDFNNPKMSKHLWLYEGVTEYFANLFQVNQGLISEDAFYKRLNDKIEHAKAYNDTLPFTIMSTNVLKDPYKDQYTNVYEKGALIAMCLDLIIRDKSNGKNGILDLMKKLSVAYGSKRAFTDDELFDKITALTFPEVGTFLANYVAGSKSINYDDYFARVGVTRTSVKVPEAKFSLSLDQSKNEIMINPNSKTTAFMKALDLRPGDIIKAFNGINYDTTTISELSIKSKEWKDGDAITVTIIRDGTEQLLTGKVGLYYKNIEGYQATDLTKETLKNAWLKK